MLSTHIALFSLQRDLLWPFFNADTFERTPPTPPVIKPHRDYAETRCKFQIDYLLHEVLPELERWMPRLRGDEIPKWLGRADPQRSLDRVTAMLAHLDKLLAAPETSDYHEPLYFGHEARPQSATSPALLALHAVLYSHARWGARHFHDVESAVAAEALLSHYPAWIRQCVVSLVLLKNIFRTAISKNPAARETGVWSQGAICFEDALLIPALADLAKRLWQPPQDGHRARPEEQSLLSDWHPGLASALALVADCYDARVGGAPGTGFPAMSGCWALQERLVEALSKDAGDGPKPALVVFEFGHYVFDADESSDARNAFVKKLLGARREDDTPADVLWISLNRYWALHHGGNIADADFSDKLLACLVEKRHQDQPACIRKNAVQVRYHFLDLDSEAKTNRDAAYQAAFRLQAAPGSVWDRLDEILKHFRENRKFFWPDYDGTPWAYVTRVLEILAHIDRDQFFTIQVERPQPLLQPFHPFAMPQAEPPANQIALPRDVPTADHLRAAVNNRDWDNPQLLVARALAALLLNQRMTFGNPRQLVQLDRDWRGDLKPNSPKAESLRRKLTASACAWLDRAEWIAERDGHKALRAYLDVFSSLPVDPVQPPAIPPDRPRLTAPAKLAQKYVLGIDIGATDVKVAVYEYDAASRVLAGLVCKSSFPVASAPLKDGDERKRYKDVDEFAARVEREIGVSINSNNVTSIPWQDMKPDVVAVGVTWPGAVGGETGHERVRAWSKILAEFEGYIRPEDQKAVVKPSGKPFWEANAQEIHERFKVREAFSRKLFPGDDERHAPVTLINDGDGHVLHALAGALVGGATFTIHQEVAVLAAGSGTAMGVVDAATPRLLDLLAEAGKVIVDIGDELADCPEKEPNAKNRSNRSQFNEATMADVAERILDTWGVVTRDDGALTLTDAVIGKTGISTSDAPEFARYFANSLLVGYLLEQDEQGKAKVANLWGEKHTLPEVATQLEAALSAVKPARTGAVFGSLVAHLMNTTYPRGTGGPLFSKVTLAQLAGRILGTWGVVVTRDDGALTLTDAVIGKTGISTSDAPEFARYFANSLLVGYLLEQDEQGKAKVANLWGEKHTLPEVATLLGEALGAANPTKTGADFAGVAAHLMGYYLADLVALTTELFGTRSVYVAGGPMSGATGKTVLDHAIDELRHRYGFHLAEPGTRELGAPHRLARLLSLERVEPQLDEPSGAHGAAVRALHLLKQRG